MNEAAQFYESRVARLGHDFLDEYARCVERIVAHPETGQSCYGRFRRMVMARFPFSVVYEILPDAISLLAVAHQRRSPGYWRKRA